jgi:hypothetical protein
MAHHQRCPLASAAAEIAQGNERRRGSRLFASTQKSTRAARVLGALTIAATAFAVLPMSPARAAVADICPAGELPDVFPDDNGRDDEELIDCAAAYGIVAGFADGTYRPTDSLTRAQAASILVRYVEAAIGEPLAAPEPDFTDIADSVHAENIAKASGAGFVLGFLDGTFGPNLTIRRDQFASMAVRATEFVLGEPLPSDDTTEFTDLDGNVHAENIEKAADADILNGTAPGTFDPSANVQRGQTARIAIQAAGNVLFPADAWASFIDLDAPALTEAGILTNDVNPKSILGSGDSITFTFTEPVVVDDDATMELTDDDGTVAVLTLADDGVTVTQNPGGEAVDVVLTADPGNVTPGETPELDQDVYLSGVGGIADASGNAFTIAEDDDTNIVLGTARAVSVTFEDSDGNGEFNGVDDAHDYIIVTYDRPVFLTSDATVTVNASGTRITYTCDSDITCGGEGTELYFRADDHNSEITPGVAIDGVDDAVTSTTGVLDVDGGEPAKGYPVAITLGQSIGV